MTSWLDINPQDLQKTAMAYDNFLREYRKEYDKAGIPEKHYSDIDEFVGDALQFDDITMLCLEYKERMKVE